MAEYHAKGGLARAAALTPEQRSKFARRAANTRWGNLMKEPVADSPLWALVESAYFLGASAAKVAIGKVFLDRSDYASCTLAINTVLPNDLPEELQTLLKELELKAKGS